VAIRTANTLEMKSPRSQSAPAEDRAIALLRLGSLDAIDVLYDHYAASLLRLARYMSGSDADAEDIVHDVFIGLPKSIRSYREEGRLGAWLSRLVVNRAIDQRRAAARRAKLHRTAAAEHTTTAASLPVQDLDVDSAIATLAPALRDVFVLRAVEGYSHADIAALLGIRTGTVHVRYFRAVRALRSRLGRSEC
jgi:RNA polymerase sigma-70 factor (ECF subfamily)